MQQKIIDLILFLLINIETDKVSQFESCIYKLEI